MSLCAVVAILNAYNYLQKTSSLYLANTEKRSTFV